MFPTFESIDLLPHTLCISERERPIGVFDSGVGGLSVLRMLRLVLPNEHFYYLADRANAPYGPKPLAMIRECVEKVAGRFAEVPVKALIVACNTASAAALDELRSHYGHILIIGMEPAIKPAAERTKRGIIGVLATEGTFKSRRYASVVERFASKVRVIAVPCPELVLRIERGETDSYELREWLYEKLSPVRVAGADVVALACTHFPLAMDAIRSVFGGDVEVIDPAPAVATYVHKRLLELDLERVGDVGEGICRFFST